jgi:hypothetical protein
VCLTKLRCCVQVMQMFDKAEAEYRELSEKKRIVENDKDKIRKVGSPFKNDLSVICFCCCASGQSGAYLWLACLAVA